MNLDIRKIAKPKRAFGINVSQDSMSFVELCSDGTKVKLLRSASVSLADGIISENTVQRPKAFAEAVRKLGIGGSLHHSRAAFAISGEPVLLQILNVPQLAPAEVSKFIREEVRQYAILPLKNIELDYCPLRSSDPHNKRLLVGAAQSEPLSLAVNQLEKHNIDVCSIEPSILAFVRSCFEKVIKPCSNKNLILVLIRDNFLNICLLKNRSIEFLRVKKLQEPITSHQDYAALLTEEIESVIQFYQLQQDADNKIWKAVIAFADKNCGSPALDSKALNLTSSVEVEVFTPAMLDIEIPAGHKEPVCAVAVGLAEKVLKCKSDAIEVGINILPKEIIEVKKDRQQMLWIANIAAVILVAMFLYIGVMSRKSRNAENYISTVKQKHLDTRIKNLADDKIAAEAKLETLSSGIESVQSITAGRSYHNWASLLAKLSLVIPQTVLIENLQTRGNDFMEISGLAVNYDSLNGFVSELTCRNIVASASVKDAGQYSPASGELINYTIVCSLVR